MQCYAASEAAPVAAAPAEEQAADVTTIDLRVGKIIKCERHPEADTLYGKCSSYNLLPAEVPWQSLT